MEIFTSPRFERNYKKLQIIIKKKIEARGNIFHDNPFDSRLDTHKLHGKDKESWAYSIDNKYRVKFLFLKNGDILYLDVGTHDEVYG